MTSLSGPSASPSMKMSKAELLEAADEAGADVDETMTKAEILEAIEEMED